MTKKEVYGKLARQHGPVIRRGKGMCSLGDTVSLKALPQPGRVLRNYPKCFVFY